MQCCFWRCKGESAYNRITLTSLVLHYSLSVAHIPCHSHEARPIKSWRIVVEQPSMASYLLPQPSNQLQTFAPSSPLPTRSLATAGASESPPPHHSHHRHQRQHRRSKISVTSCRSPVLGQYTTNHHLGTTNHLYTHQRRGGDVGEWRKEGKVDELCHFSAIRVVYLTHVPHHRCCCQQYSSKTLRSTSPSFRLDRHCRKWFITEKRWVKISRYAIFYHWNDLHLPQLFFPEDVHKLWS